MMAEADPNACCFQSVFHCSDTSVDLKLIRCTKLRLENIITKSKLRGDGLHEQLSLHDLETHPIFFHKNCVSTYTSTNHIKRYLSKINRESKLEEPAAKKVKRSETPHFEFKKNCLFCGELCKVEVDGRHPERQRRIVQCRTADCPTAKTFKERILDVCNERNDKPAEDVRLRIQGAVSDLHAADAQYHKDCEASFMSPRSIKAAKNASSSIPQYRDEAYEKLKRDMESNDTKVWNSVELHDMYKTLKGKDLTRKQLMRTLQESFGSELLFLSSPGVANVVVFRSKAAGFLKLVPADDDDDIAVSKVGRKILQETKLFNQEKSAYQTRMCKEDALAAASPTLLDLLGIVSTKFEMSLQSILIGNIVTSIVTNRPTPLQVSLGIVLRDKSVIEQMYKFGVCCTYDEVRRFKASAAHAAANSHELTGLMNESGLVQTVADNFDANISSQNGLRSTHALALLITQPQSTVNMSNQESPTIRRIKKEEMADEIIPDVPIQRFIGPKKPEMPACEATHSPLQLSLLASQVLSKRRARDLDFSFFKDIANKPGVAEFNGYNTQMAREQGHAVRPQTKAVYCPLIDMVPSDPDTMLTAMVEAENKTRAAGQTFTIFTTDQQLYRVVLAIMWVYPDRFKHFIPRLGGMHTLMNFAGAVGNLMVNTGLEELMQAAFGGVQTMLTGKNFPQNVRALRMIVEVLLCGLLTEHCDTFEDLMGILEARASLNRTAKQWLENLIKPVFIMMAYVRAEREADWVLHLEAVADMLPYFFSSGHFNYARYCLYYLHSMGKLPGEVLAEFLKGNHVMRHAPGIWNAIWSDMYVESTFMRYGHGPGGIVGITLQPSALKRWAYSLHICTQLTKDVADIQDYSTTQPSVLTHKEEMPARKRSDAIDRERLQEKLATIIHPLDKSESQDIVNVVTGRYAPKDVNVDHSVEIGKEQLKEYMSAWPDSFYKPLKKKVVTMSVLQKHVKVGHVQVFEPSLIYSRILCLQQVHEINIKDVLKHELSPVPPSLFEDNGDMRITKSKATLKKRLEVEVPSRFVDPPEATIIDGCAVLWVVPWPSKGTILDFILNFVTYLNRILRSNDAFLIFDRYYPSSIKDVTRLARSGKGATRRHQLNLNTPLPPQKIVLTVTENKVQLIDLICQYLKENASTLPQNGKSLTLTGRDPIPMEIKLGNIKPRQNMKVLHEEADVIIVKQVMHLAEHSIDSIEVICDDTDVFVLLLHYYVTQQLSCQLHMVGTSHSRHAVDIKATAEGHRNLAKDILGAHALSGCDSVSCLYGIGKVTVIKTMQSGHSLGTLGDPGIAMPDVIAEATRFIAACYGSKITDEMSAVRFDAWTAKLSKKTIASAPELRSLPPTNAAFELHVKRAHFQTMIWKAAREVSPPEFDPKKFGWESDGASSLLLPVPLPAEVLPVPEVILKLIKCGCASSRPCATARCSCVAAKLACSMFCACHAENDCHNDLTEATVDVTDDNQ